jgi:hypothetical protein
MKTDFKVYSRKIHVYYKKSDGLWYAWSTNAFKRCRDAVADAKQQRPQWDFQANFAKD